MPDTLLNPPVSMFLHQGPEGAVGLRRTASWSWASVPPSVCTWWPWWWWWPGSLREASSLDQSVTVYCFLEPAMAHTGDVAPTLSDSQPRMIDLCPGLIKMNSLYLGTDSGLQAKQGPETVHSLLPQGPGACPSAYHKSHTVTQACTCPLPVWSP
jgi:hypothetical protein